MRIALVSQEVHPLHGGGIGHFVSAAATLLSQIAEVTIFTTSVLEPRYRELAAAGDAALPPASVRFVFVPWPTDEEAAGWYHVMQPYSARVLEALKETYADAPPDLIEFGDFLGEGFVTLQAAATLDPFLRTTRIAVRIHTTAELAELLNGYVKPDFPSRAVHQFERFSLARADRVIWQGGDILGTYQRYYGAAAIAPNVRIRYPYAGPQDALPPLDDGPLRLLYVGRLERRKNVAALIQAVTGIARDDLRLTLAGADTATGPLGGSVRARLELAIGDDPRIALLGGLDHRLLLGAIAEHDVVVVPSLWECWPYAALEPLHLGRPVLATPVGGLVELVRPGAGGWLAAGTAATDIDDAITALLDDRGAVRDLTASGRPIAHARAVADNAEILDGYRALVAAPLTRELAPGRLAGASPARLGTPLGSPPPGPPGPAAPPLVSAVVPYFRASAFVRETVASLVAQTYPRLEIVIVDDGSFDDADWVLGELAARFPAVVVCQMNQGLGAARNFGITQTRGRYVFPLDADNVAEPEFVSRCVAVLEARPAAAYVTAWSQYIDDAGAARTGPNLGYEPLGNWSSLIDEDNVAGDAAAVLRRSVFDAGFWYSDELTSYEDWAFYRRLAAAGRFGEVIPQRLLRYRVRADSMQATIAQPNRSRLEGEILAHTRENEVRWTSSNA